MVAGWKLPHPGNLDIRLGLAQTRQGLVLPALLLVSLATVTQSAGPATRRQGLADSRFKEPTRSNLTETKLAWSPEKA
jgi:hypothetical protein